MTTPTSGVGSSGSAGANSASSLASSLPSAQLGESDFLNLLITQLKNQDPTNPMDDQQFAVQLAQFSQLQTLIDIDGKVGNTSSAGDLSSLSSYLGQEVVTNSSSVTVQNNNGGQAAFVLPSDAADVQVQLVDSSGAVVESVDAGALKAGQQNVDLSNLSTSSGTYNLQVLATDAAGGQSQPEAFAAGIVSGVIPGANPALIVNGVSIPTGSVSAVLTPPKTS